jgi:antirestriction protein
MPSYDKTVIYKIQHRERPNLLYVGCTTNFNARKHQHRCRVSNVGDKEYNAYKYKMIRDHGGWDAFEMKPVKIISCNSKLEAEIEEEKTRVELKATLNSNTKPIYEPKRVSFLGLKRPTYTIDDLE